MDYFKEYINELSSKLNSVNQILKFTTNTEVIGQYAEKLVTNFISDFLSELKMSTGTIIYPEMETNLKQIDLILWDANPLPPIYNVSNFGLVPRNSVYGILEIKRTDYDNGLQHIEDLYQTREKYFPDIWIEENKLENYMSENCFLGLICVLEYHKTNGNNKYTMLKSKLKNSLIHLLERDNGNYKVNSVGVIQLINYISSVRKFHKTTGKEFSLYVKK